MAAPPDILQLSKSQVHLFEKFCCIYEALNGQKIESQIQTVQLTTNCFKSNFTPMVRWNQIFYLMYKSNMTYNEDKCMSMCREEANTISYFYHVAYILMFILTVSSNLLVIFAILKTTKLRSTIANLFILSLAFSDLFVGLFIIPIKIKKSLNNMHFCLNDEWCRFYITTDNVFFSISITNLLVIAIDRYIALHYTYAYPRILTRTRAKIVIAALWFYGIIWGFLANIPWDDSGNDAITINRGSCVLENSYYIYSVFVLVFSIPVIVMGVIYIRIFLIARHHANDIVNSTSLSHNNNSKQNGDTHHGDISLIKEKKPKRRSILKGIRSSFTSGFTRRHDSAQYYKMIFKASKTVATVYGTFVVSWAPVCIISATLHACVECFGAEPTESGHKWYTVVFVNFLPILASMANPFIYAILSKQYRRAFKKILLGVYPKSFRWMREQSNSSSKASKKSYAESVLL
ncbi:adenosine receptor A2b-like [Clytia hemisphaerica]|uniref:G-protein coupled receptors family 1 profile domain-containing protein n=1 Tax=Clytia hemisphaerica TaxID=252671 RepID=A0A7M5X8U3_9CNID